MQVLIGCGSVQRVLGQERSMLLRATGIVVRHHPSLPPTLAGVSLHVAAGEVVAIVGANGSGKSTLARALVGLVPLDAGQVEGADGRAVRVGLVLQDPAAQLIAVTVADDIALGPETSGRLPADVAHTVAHYLALHDLHALGARDPATLSGGQQQRVAVAAIEACDIGVLVLDEPTALLDGPARRRCATQMRAAAAAGRAVIWITQEPDELAMCDRVIVLDAGVVVWEGGVREYVEAPHIAASFGLELPAAPRIAHTLAARRAWPASHPIPVTMNELVEALGAAGGSPRG